MEQLFMFDSFNVTEDTQNSTIPKPVIEKIITSSYRRYKSKGKLDELPPILINTDPLTKNSPKTSK